MDMYDPFTGDVVGTAAENVAGCIEDGPCPMGDCEGVMRGIIYLSDINDDESEVFCLECPQCCHLVVG